MNTATSDDTLIHEVGDEGRVAISVPAGEVVVQGRDGPTVEIRDLDGKPLEDRFVIERGTGRLEIRMRDTTLLGLGLLSGRNARARLRVELPARAKVEVDTASAEVNVRGCRGQQRYRTASGNVRAAGSGTLTIDSVSGDVRVDADGEVELASRVVSGDINVLGGSLRSAAISSTSGDIELRSALVGPGPYAIQTVSGDAIVRAGAGLKVEAKTLTGELESAIRAGLGRGRLRGRRELVVGDGRYTLTFKSISGDLRLVDTPPASGLPVSPAAPEPPAAPTTPEQPSPPQAEGDPGRDARLEILHDLEAGRLDVALAGERLAALDGEADA